MGQKAYMHRLEVDDNMTPVGYFAYTESSDDIYVRVHPEVTGTFVTIVIPDEAEYKATLSDWYQFEDEMNREGLTPPTLY